MPARTRDALTRADQRYYDENGGFWSPDPGGAATANPSDPNSWNRYAYAGNDPVNHLDPSGNAVICAPVGYYLPTGQSDPNCYWQGEGNVPDCGIVDAFNPMPGPPSPSCYSPVPPPAPTSDDGPQIECDVQIMADPLGDGFIHTYLAATVTD